MENFVFISYKSDDREQIRPYLQMLEKNGIKYWWDQRIKDEWGRDIDQKLEECAAVISFLTERSTSPEVYTEIKRAKDAGKLIPVKLDRAKLRYEFESTIAFLNYIDLSSESIEKNEAELQRLLCKISEKTGAGAGNVLASSGKMGVLSKNDMEAWLLKKERLPHLAYIVALCFFGGQSHEFIQFCVAFLEQKFIEAGLDNLLGLRSEIITRTNKLGLINATVLSYRSKITESDVEQIVFEDHLFGEKALLCLWNEFDQLRLPIIEWIELLLDRYPTLCLGDIAAALSKIGRNNFRSLYDFLLQPWLNRSRPSRFRCADIALSLLVDTPAIKQFVRKQMLQVEAGEALEEFGTTSSSNDTKSANEDPPAQEDATSVNMWALSRSAAIALVTGYTGMAMPDLSIALFKRIEDDLLTDHNMRFADLMRSIDKGIDFMLTNATSDGYARSLTLVFAKGICDWIPDEAEGRRSYLPEFIFLRLLERLTLEADRRRITLPVLLDGDAEFGINTMLSFAKIVSRSLESGNRFIRDGYTKWMKSWRNKIKTAASGKRIDAAVLDEENDVFLKLFDAAVHYASSPNDVERIKFNTQL